MVVSVEVSEEERNSGRLSEEHRHTAVAALETDGVVVLNDVVAIAHLEALQERMTADLERILARKDVPFNFNSGNVQQDPPPFPPYLFRDVLLNDLVIEVTHAVLGPGLKNSFYSGNTALPGGERQPVHPDVAQLWPGLRHSTPAFGLVVNVPIVDMSWENGSTEIWPGTHHDTTYSIHDSSIRIPQEVLDARREERAPFQPEVRRGAILIRDIRLWHAGMPNHTDTPRPMIAMIHWCSWWPDNDPISFPQGTEAFINHPVLKTNARFVEGIPDHTQHNKAYDFQK